MTAFLVLLLFAVQVALNLYAASAVSGVAFDAARRVAGSDGGPASVAAAEVHARGVLERFEAAGGRLEFDWDTSRTDAVVLTVRAARPSPFARLSLPFQQVTRTVRVRWEVFR